MFSKESFKKLLSLGLDAGQYLILYYLNLNIQIEDLLNLGGNVKGQVNLLVRKGLVLLQGVQYAITQKGRDVLAELSEEEQVYQQASKQYSIDLIYAEVATKLFQLTGKKQVQSRVRNRDYPFMCNRVDFTAKMESFLKRYKPQDMQRVEACLLQFIERCYETDQWSPLLKYYILKDDQSNLMNDYELYEEPIQEGPKKVINTKELF